MHTLSFRTISDLFFLAFVYFSYFRARSYWKLNPSRPSVGLFVCLSVGHNFKCISHAPFGAIFFFKTLVRKKIWIYINPHIRPLQITAISWISHLKNRTPLKKGESPIQLFKKNLQVRPNNAGVKPVVKGCLDAREWWSEIWYRLERLIPSVKILTFE